ncbi:MAG: hypothetical protein AAGG08_06185 [Actinomycetota bacterium]
MIDAVVGFAALLRSHGIGVGADRTLLASRAIRLVDVADPVAVRRALRLTLLLSGNDEERFGQLFDEWFTADPFEAQLSASRDSVDADTDGVENDAVGDPGSARRAARHVGRRGVHRRSVRAGLGVVGRPRRRTAAGWG